MRLTLNYSVCTAISACTHPCDRNTFTLSLTRMYLLQSKIQNIWISFFEKLNYFPFRHNRNFTPKFIWIMIIYIINMIIYIIIFDKTVWWCYLFIIILLAYVNNRYIGNTAVSNFSVLPHKNKCFWLNFKCTILTWVFKMAKIMWVIFNCSCVDLFAR